MSVNVDEIHAKTGSTSISMSPGNSLNLLCHPSCGFCGNPTWELQSFGRVSPSATQGFSRCRLAFIGADVTCGWGLRSRSWLKGWASMGAWPLGWLALCATVSANDCIYRRSIRLRDALRYQQTIERLAAPSACAIRWLGLVEDIPPRSEVPKSGALVF